MNMVKYDKQPINIQPSVPNALSPTINSPIIPAKCTNEPSATVELYLIKMLPSAFIKIAHFEAYRLKILERAHEIRKLIAMTLKRSQGSFGKKCMGKKLCHFYNSKEQFYLWFLRCYGLSWIYS